MGKQFSVGKKLQIFDLDKKEMVKDHSLDEDVVFWTWIDEETIGAVTESAVYHWALASEFIEITRQKFSLKRGGVHPTFLGRDIFFGP